MDPHDYLDAAAESLKEVKGETYDVLDVGKPETTDEAVELSQVINKITPIVANTIEFRIAEYLNENMDLPDGARWERQDPEFPDVVLKGIDGGEPGIEIKAWYPLSTEMTGRFRETQRHLQDGLTKIAILAWLPEWVIYGEPQIVDVFVDDALEVAQSRDDKYHDPPQYLVMEPQDTSNRTRNLQQSNVRGHRFQEDDEERIEEAEQLTEDLALKTDEYDSSFEYHRKLGRLYSEFEYRQESNFAKLARLKHTPLDDFDDKVMNSLFAGRTIVDWRSAIRQEDENATQDLLDGNLGQQKQMDSY
ncbi:hypothetical protein [Halorussus caseinilyticus]|uniref:hypothetical protein n=1 Tax=Halorussus caseinilyticus TaxID=3034025 RepID=UPI0023E7E1C6|nr:hypothetical protein [Halorussus sp. DT72]